VFASGAAIDQADDTRTAFEVSRAELGVDVGLHAQVAAGVRVEAIRAVTADGGVIGVDGDSLVLRLKRAQLSAWAPLAGGAVILGADAGLVADPWIEALDAGYALRALAPTASEGLLGWASSDLGGRVTVDALDGRIRAAAALTNGEGRNYPERNDGKNATGMVDVRAVGLDLAGRPAELRIRAGGRRGSLGPGAARDHRIAGAIAATWGDAAAAVEVARAYGLDSMATVEATAVAAWLHAPIWHGLGVTGRYAALKLDGGGDTAHTITGGVAYDVVGPTAARAARVFLVGERATDRLTGAGTTADATSILLVVSATGFFNLE
jgi:hypothetical protein